MSDLCRLIWCALIGLFRPRAALEAEILVLRHQLNVLRRKSPKRVAFGNIDRLVFAGLYRVAPVGRTENSQAADGDPLAPRWVPSLLALEITTARWPAKDTGGHSPAHPGHERREPALGSATDPRRTAQAWHRCRADHRGKIHGQETAATVAGLEDLSAQPHRRDRVDGFVRSPDALVSAVVWISDLAAFPPRASVARCDRTPECPLDCPSTDRSLRLATDATIYRSRSGLRVWRCRHRAASSNGHTGSADLTTVAMAKRILGEAHRFDPAGFVLTMSLCSANDISAICSVHTKNITTRLGRTYRCTRTRPSRVPFTLWVARWRCQFSADCTTNISGRKFPTGTGG
jgi:hypothetical protein